ncbi:BamA/TamA family outer membrane protein [candidate division WOR-3 bacterium]|nr:BamA/TamA family outer membrane protein [candidate division WOR-3 bacterium]
MRGILYVLLIIVQQLAAKTLNDSHDARIGLTLSAGGALGLAHIGVLKVLEREEIAICCISSNSMGSMLGGLYAAGYTATQIESIAVDLDWEELLIPSFKFTTQYLPKSQQTHRYVFRWSHDRFSPSIPSELISLQKVEFTLMRLLSKIQYNTYYSFDSLRIPLRVIAVDLVSGCRVVMKQGRLDRAIRGSIAIPGVFAPQTTANQILVDGGVLQYFPVDPLHEFDPDLIIASLTLKLDTTAAVSLIDVVSRTTSLVGFEDIRRQKLLADVVIEPDLEAFDAQDYSRAQEIINAGEIAAEEALAAIRKQLAGRKPTPHQKEINERAVPYVRTVHFDGLKKTRERKIKNEIRTAPGTTLCFDRLIDDMERLYDTGLFENVNYRLELSGKDSVDIVFEVQEKAYGFYLLGLRYDNMDNASLGLEIGQSNILGSGVCVRVAINLGDPNEYRVGIADTRVFTLPLGYQFDLFWNSIDRSHYEEGTWQADYNTDCRGGMVEIGYTLGRQSYANMGIDACQAVHRFPESPFFDTIPEKEWIVGPTCNLENNNYDDFYFPTRGGDYKIGMLYSSKAMGASSNFLRLQINLDQIIPLASRFLITTGLDVGTSRGDLAWAKHFYTGGANFVGFMAEEFTTQHKVVLRLGLDIKLLSIFSENNPIYLQFLSNVALFEPLDELMSWDNRSLTDLELGIGTGIRTNTPIGPLRITFGVGNLHRTPREDNIRYAAYFSLGRDFRYTK